MTRPDRHNEVELNLVLSGSLTYLFGGARVTISPRGLTAFWAAIPHQVLASQPAGTETEYFVVTIPLVWFLQLQLPDLLVQPILDGRMVHDPDPEQFRPDCERFERWTEDLGGTVATRNRAALLEIEARLLRFASALTPDDPNRTNARCRQRPRNEGELCKAEQMAGYIARHYAGPLTVEEISRSVGLHPGYAMTLFQQTFGMTLIAYVTQHRITHAQRLLATTDEKILTIALDAGFGSLSRFNDAFKRACGCTPRQHRGKFQVR